MTLRTCSGQHRDDYLLVLRNAQDGAPVGLLALQPRLRGDARDLVRVCRRHGVELALLTEGNTAVARAVAARAGVTLLDEGDSVAAIRARQRDGGIVGFVSDNANAGPAFAACDLAIGVTAGQNGFPALTDLMAPDLRAVASIVEAAARRRDAVRDAVILSAVANVAGLVWGFGGAPGIEEAGRAVNVAALAAIADGWLRLRGGAVRTQRSCHPQATGRSCLPDTMGMGRSCRHYTALRRAIGVRRLSHGKPRASARGARHLGPSRGF